MRWVTRIGVLGVACVIAACSNDGGDGSRGSSRGTSGAPNQFGNAEDPGTATAGSGGSDFGNGNGMTTAPGGDGAPMMVELMTDEGSCGATKLAAEQVIVEEQIMVDEEVTSVEPVAIYIMLDQSGSMVLLWPAAVTSIQQFVDDTMSEGVDVALGYFPAFGVCSTGAVYDTPEVPLGRLPGHAQAIKDNLGLHAPFGIGTPTEGALRGVTAFCERFQASNPDQKCVAVLISDGAPTDEGGSCATDQTTLSSIAGASFNQGVLTYTVGLAGADFNMLNAIADAGGSDCDPMTANSACDVSAGADKLVEALRAIRDEVTTVETRIETITMTVETPLECEWQIPSPPEGEVFDREKVNVTLTSTVAATPELGKVDSAASCAAGGWHYDDPTSPSRIIACPETCETIQATPQATIDILLGCATIPLE